LIPFLHEDFRATAGDTTLGDTICHACDSSKWNRVILFYYFTFVAAAEEADEGSDDFIDEEENADEPAQPN